MFSFVTLINLNMRLSFAITTFFQVLFSRRWFLQLTLSGEKYQCTEMFETGAYLNFVIKEKFEPRLTNIFGSGNNFGGTGHPFT